MIVNDEINQTFELIKKKTDINVFDPIVFKKIYIFVISNQIIINEKRVLLIPLIDLLNHYPRNWCKIWIFWF